MPKPARRARRTPRLVLEALTFGGRDYGAVPVVARKDGVLDLRPAAVAHWTPEELASFMAWDQAVHRTEWPGELAIAPGHGAPRNTTAERRGASR